MNTGTIHKTKYFGELRIIKYEKSKVVHVEFISTGFKKIAQADHIRKGCVKDLLRPNVFGVGFIGDGHFISKSPAHSSWESMMNRCYSKSSAANNPTYKSCSVHPDWHNFQNFAKWYEENYPNDGGNYQLDKDLLLVGNKIYSAGRCVFVPSWLNSFTENALAIRGDYPIGVTYFKRDGNFRAQCSLNGKKKHLGYFSTPEAAHLAWRKYKLQLAINKKTEMDAIDLRIYPNVVQIINEAR